jgi:hypothetical protein
MTNAAGSVGALASASSHWHIARAQLPADSRTRPLNDDSGRSIGAHLTSWSRQVDQVDATSLARSLREPLLSLLGKP